MPDMVPDAQGYSTPRPDPTILTTEQLFREIGGLEGRINLQIVAADERLKAETRWTEERFRNAESEREHLKGLLGERIAGVGREIQTAFSASEKATEKVAVAIDKRFETVNEFRGQLADIQRTLLPRAEGDVKIAALEEKINDMKSTIDKGFTGMETSDKIGTQHWGYVVGAVGLIAVIVTAIVNIVHYAH